MSASLIERTPSAYDYPLLIKHLLHTPLATTPEQEIVYRDSSRYTYRTLRQRIGRLASGLAGLGARPGDTVAVTIMPGPMSSSVTPTSCRSSTPSRIAWKRRTPSFC